MVRKQGHVIYTISYTRVFVTSEEVKNSAGLESAPRIDSVLSGWGEASSTD